MVEVEHWEIVGRTLITSEMTAEAEGGEPRNEKNPTARERKNRRSGVK